MAEGYIKLYRSLLDNWVWQERPFSKGQAWVDLLLLANHKDVKAMRKDEVITYRRGTVNMSISALAERWGWNRKTAAKFIKALESDGMVSVARSYKWTTVSIENYSVFQNSGSSKRTTEWATEGNTDGQLTGHRTIMNNNDNNVNNAPDGDTHMDEPEEEEKPEPMYVNDPEATQRKYEEAIKKLRGGRFDA